MADGTEQSGQSSSQGGSQQTQAGGGSQQGNSSQANQQSGQGSQTAQTQQQSKPSRPDWLPESFWDTGKNEIKGTDLRGKFDELSAFKAADDVRRNALPAKPEDYKIELPKDFQAPQGVKYEFNINDPLLAQARGVFHDIQQGKFSGQEAFSKLLGLYAGAQMSDQARITEARNAEIGKLGANGPARIDALTTFWKSYLGDTEGAQFMSRMFTASDVQIAEKVVQKITSQGGNSFTGSGREPPDKQGRLSDEQYNKLSSAEKLDYSRRFDQSKMGPWRDPRGVAA